MDQWMKDRMADGFRERFRERREETQLISLARALHEATLPFRDVRVAWENLGANSREVYTAQAKAVLRTHYVLPRGS